MTILAGPKPHVQLTRAWYSPTVVPGYGRAIEHVNKNQVVLVVAVDICKSHVCKIAAVSLESRPMIWAFRLTLALLALGMLDQTLVDHVANSLVQVSTDCPISGHAAGRKD